MNVADTKKKLEKYEKEIGLAKTDISKMEGSIEQQLKTLKDEYGIKDLKSAKKELVVAEDKLKVFEADLESKMNNLEKDYKI